ncbi:OmpA family protein [Kribbella sp. CA-293567]|uniref:OmpA family protein n=1 Tax=Kribbella sp. CA-293567 TaxID=3002436 RepID=UPI0022DD421D|nr:OmpA family protein [Kribbella sp. CA-293567]WBQ04590.1 OmpA family protein [Kribbella sp. CA-293567]
MRSCLLAIAVTGALVACDDDGKPSSGGSVPPSAPGSATVSATPGTPSTTSASSTPPTPAPDPECTPGPGRTVEQLPPATVAEVAVPPLTYDSGGQQKTAMEGFTIPAQTVPAGCVIRYDAPGGCLGAIKITGATIPPVTIPGSTLTGSTLTGSGKEFPGVTVPGRNAPAVTSPQICQVETKGVLPTVTRKGVVRRGVSRNGAARPGGFVRGEGEVPDLRVPTVKVPELQLPDVDVDPARLESRKLPGQDKVDVFTGEGAVSYVAPGDVLFDTDQATIRPDAAKALHAIALKIKAGAPGAKLRVEGHTDDRGDATYGLRLSERRAQAVASYLIGIEKFPAARISTKGFGEAAPAVPNSSDANRQKNRRVVITVAAG